jgi:hypothetical protein
MQIQRTPSAGVSTPLAFVLAAICALAGMIFGALLDRSLRLPSPAPAIIQPQTKGAEPQTVIVQQKPAILYRPTPEEKQRLSAIRESEDKADREGETAAAFMRASRANLRRH